MAVKNSTNVCGKFFKYLRTLLCPGLDHTCWTSLYRNEDYPRNRFTEPEKDWADFTVCDVSDRLGQHLASQTHGFVQPKSSTDSKAVITYHLEVKTAKSKLETPVKLSDNQISLAQKYSRRGFGSSTSSGSRRHPTDVYVLVRVYDIEAQHPPDPKVSFFIDPWDRLCKAASALLSDKVGNGFYVWPALSEIENPAVTLAPQQQQQQPENETATGVGTEPEDDSGNSSL